MPDSQFIRLLEHTSQEYSDWILRYTQPSADDQEVSATVSEMLAQVRARGFQAIAEYTEQFDGWSPSHIDQLFISEDQLRDFASDLNSETRAALDLAAQRITQVHTNELQVGDRVLSDDQGVVVSQSTKAVSACGAYAPGGAALYPSSVLMNLIPARVAGVARRVLVSPIDPAAIPPQLAHAALLGGCTDFLALGGVQAIAMLAYGTDAFAPVDVITGPGNKWVAEAKRQVYGRVGIDSLAGPSEIVIIADDSADPKVIALDMCAQAEHDVDARALVFVDDSDLANAIVAELHTVVPTLERSDIIRQSLATNGAVVVFDNLAQAVTCSNQLAPEHLQLSVATANMPIAADVANAGAIFIGHNSAEVLGDYTAGSNHTLPTGTAARFTGGLSTTVFTKSMATVTVTSTVESQPLWRAAATIADSEGLGAHAAAARARLTNLDKKG